MYIYADLEADSLTPSVIWCVCVLYGDTEETFYDKNTFLKFVEQHNEDTWVFHNGIGYDLGVLDKLWGIQLNEDKVVDTLVLSRLQEPSREGGHSLRAHGEALGFRKGDHEDFSRLTPEMVSYCQQDVRVTKKLHESLMRLLKGQEEAIELEHKVAFIIKQQEVNGWLLDQRKCYELLAKVKQRTLEVEDEVRGVFRPICVSVGVVYPRYKKNGELSKVGLGFLGDLWECVGGNFTRIDWPEFNLGSRQQIGKYLMHFGWKPNEFTPTGHPKVDEKVLEGVELPQAKLIAEYLMLQKREAMVSSWLEAMGEDGRVHGKVNSNGAVTGRMTHNSPNMAQVTANGKPYGKDCRECWTVPDGYSLVGVDASGLELRMLAHYMNDPQYTKEILEGDIHTANQIAAGLETRNQAKTFIYAFLYGAGDAKIGSIVGKGAEEGAELKIKFLKNTPALSKLKNRVDTAAKRGHIKGLDGRTLHIRSEHAALNTLLQSAGAIVMKKALCILDNYAKIWKLKYRFVANVHDEWQTEVATKDAEKFGALAVSSIQAAGIHFNLKCPLDGEYHIGNNWSETH